jgi:YHS domain-containing protein
MSKTHGFVATAWVLGGGILLGSNQTAPAQIPNATDDADIPREIHPIQPQLAPGFAPGANALSRPMSRPATSHSSNAWNRSFDASHKMIPGGSASASSSSQARMVTPANYLPQPSGVAPAANQEAAAPSSVQQKLEELYRRDGRPMPNMNFNHTPVHVNAGVPNASSPGSQGQIVPAQAASKPRSLLEKLNPFSRFRSAPARMPQQVARPIPTPSGQAVTTRPGTAPAPYGMSGTPAANQFRAPAPLNQVAAPLPKPEAPALPLPAPAVSVSENAVSSQLSDTLPPVPGDPGYSGASSTSVELPIPPAPATVDAALESAFSDMPEEKASTLPSIEPAPKADEESPFGELSLDDAFGPAKPAVESQKAEGNSAAVATENALPKISTASTPEITPAEIPLPEDAQPVAETPLEEMSEDEINAKKQLIAERGELRGLKGFCPVALRDDRDLKNAMPEHHSVYRGRTYYFSTADAKSQFDAAPHKYAPVSGGQDVVLLKEKVTKEGSLDHAVWFKDRLYLFTSQKTLERFVAAPKEFAIHE